MEAALIDFEEWVKSMPVQEITYYGVFDPSTGKIIGIYPNHSCPDTKSRISIDEDIALSIMEARTSLSSYAVDIDSESLEIIETKSLTKIDDVLHRVIDQRWSDIVDTDVLLSLNPNDKKLIITLSEKFYKNKKIRWDGSTEMLFLITDYNDPNGLYDTISVTIDHLFAVRSAEYTVDFPKEFSVYTKRIFKNYMLKYENS